MPSKTAFCFYLAGRLQSARQYTRKSRTHLLTTHDQPALLRAGQRKLRFRLQDSRLTSHASRLKSHDQNAESEIPTVIV